MIPHFYATDAEEKFLELRQQKEEEWKSRSEDEQSRLRLVFDDLQKEIVEQQEMAALIRDDLEDVGKIGDSEMPELDDVTQKKYDDIVQKQMEEKLSERIAAEDQKRKWLLEEVNISLFT